MPEAGVTASGVVAVEPAERVEAGLAFAGPCLAALKRRAFERRVKGSASALSALEPIALMDWRTPAWLQASAKARLVYSAPWSVCRTAPARLPRVCSAAAKASVTRLARMRSAIAQPARWREARSMTVARYRNFLPSSGR